jgi:hypothetical protein
MKTFHWKWFPQMVQCRRMATRQGINNRINWMKGWSFRKVEIWTSSNLIDRLPGCTSSCRSSRPCRACWYYRRTLHGLCVSSPYYASNIGWMSLAETPSLRRNRMFILWSYSIGRVKTSIFAPISNKPERSTDMTRLQHALLHSEIGTLWRVKS